MKRNIILGWRTAFLLLMFAPIPPAGAQSLKAQLTALVAQLQSSPQDQELRKKIIQKVLTFSKQPAAPEDLVELMGKAKAIMKDAKSPEDYKEAVKVFQQASLLAPWLGDLYYNLGVVQEKAEEPEDAVTSFNYYLLAKPHAKDRESVKERIGALEYKAEKSVKLKQVKGLIEQLRGPWYCSFCGEPGDDFAASIKLGCTAAEFDGSYWVGGAPSGQTAPALQMEIENDGTVKLIGQVWNAQAGCYEGPVFGVPQGDSFSSIRWEIRPATGAPRQIWSRMSQDGNTLWISCTRPLSGGDDTIHYSYACWSRTAPVSDHPSTRPHGFF